MARVPDLYQTKAPPFPPGPKSPLAKFVKVVYRQNFKPMKFLHCSLGLGIFARQSVFSQTCDGLVWPTSVMIMAARDTGELFPRFIGHFQMQLASRTPCEKKMSRLGSDLSLPYVAIESTAR